MIMIVFVGEIGNTTELTAIKGVGFALSHAVNYVLNIGLLNFFLWCGLSKELAPFSVFAIMLVNFVLVRFVLKR